MLIVCKYIAKCVCKAGTGCWNPAPSAASGTRHPCRSSGERRCAPRCDPALAELQSISVVIRTRLVTSISHQRVPPPQDCKAFSVQVVQECSAASCPRPTASRGVATALFAGCVNRQSKPRRSWPSLAWPALSRCKTMGACAADSTSHSDCRGSQQLMGNRDAMISGKAAVTFDATQQSPVTAVNASARTTISSAYKAVIPSIPGT